VGPGQPASTVGIGPFKGDQTSTQPDGHEGRNCKRSSGMRLEYVRRSGTRERTPVIRAYRVWLHVSFLDSFESDARGMHPSEIVHSTLRVLRTSDPDLL
jgi:hypothetical protein